MEQEPVFPVREASGSPLKGRIVSSQVRPGLELPEDELATLKAENERLASELDTSHSHAAYMRLNDENQQQYRERHLDPKFCLAWQGCRNSGRCEQGMGDESCAIWMATGEQVSMLVGKIDALQSQLAAAEVSLKVKTNLYETGIQERDELQQQLEAAVRERDGMVETLYLQTHTLDVRLGTSDALLRRVAEALAHALGLVEWLTDLDPDARKPLEDDGDMEKIAAADALLSEVRTHLGEVAEPQS